MCTVRRLKHITTIPSYVILSSNRIILRIRIYFVKLKNRPCSGKLPYKRVEVTPENNGIFNDLFKKSATSRSFFLAIYMNADYPWLQLLSI